MLTLACVTLSVAGGCCTGGSCFADHHPPITAEDVPS
jgi:hypothetical protein